MEFDSACGTGVVLGLSLNSSSSMVSPNTMSSTKQPSASLDHVNKGMTETISSFEPSLTLGLSSNHGDQNHHEIHLFTGLGGDHGILYQQKSSVISGGGSSFTNMSAKRERLEAVSEESERVMSGVTSVEDVEDDDDCVNGRKKLRLTKPQSALLEEAFKHHSSLNPKEKQELARELKLRPRQVEVWFQNRRARTKLKQTEMNFEHLKRCCEKLTHENRRLQKEVQELKALKSSSPFYMQLPSATLTMCPSCERIGDTKTTHVKNPFAMATKPHFLDSFTNPSAA